MLYVSLVLCLVLLLTANLAARWPRVGGPLFVGCGLVFACGPLLVGFFLPPVAVLFALLLAARTVGNEPPRRPFPALSVAATVIAFGVAGLFAWPTQREFARLRAEYPYESLEDRLPAPHPAYPLSEDAVERLAQLEAELPRQPGASRGALLRRLHEDKVELFVNSPGFGVARILQWPSRDGLVPWLPENPVPQPGPRGASPDNGEPQTPGAELRRLHHDGVGDFANAAGFGFVKDRRHVAGFRPHQFHALPAPAERWEVQTLDLVGLVTHPEPAAYVSAELPRMEELRHAPTRPLSRFEASALEALRRGEDIVAEGTPTALRMLGSIRNARQCVECHGGERGDLLGAFSYTLRHDGR